MDCDRVFTVLTGAPFPTGGSIDAPVERHLLACDSCRRIAEALRPCESLCHEGLPRAERSRLPRYRSELSPVLASDKESAGRSRRVEHPAHARSPRSSWRSGGWHAAFDYATPTPQVAAFALAPRVRGGWLWDLASITALAGLVAVCGWGLGWLTL